ncbi:MAG TPA: GNAT family N-acetyltransferase [Armatimonadota bacterium]|jgi:CelD/BcsL family acetyltransferase involved in cellulose biosynthesis
MTVLLQDEMQFIWVPWEQELDPAMRRAWTGLLSQRSDVLPTQHPAAWEIGRTIWPRAGWRILLVQQGDRPIAVLPMVQRSPWSWSILDYLVQDFPPVVLASGQEAAAWQAIGRWQRQAGIGQLLLGRSNSAKDIGPFHAARLAGIATTQTPTLAGVELALGDSEEAYMAGLHANARSHVRRAEARLQQEYADFQLTTLTDPSSAAEPLAMLVHLYRQHWHQQVGGCVFDDPRMVEFFTQGMHTLLVQGRAAVHALQIDGRTVAAMTTLCEPGQRSAYFQFSGRDLHALSHRHSPGIIVLLRAIRHLRAQGVATLQLGSGATWYKLEIGGVSRPQWQLATYRSAVAEAIVPRLEHATHLARRAPVHLAYHWQRLRQCLGAAT